MDAKEGLKRLTAWFYEYVDQFVSRDPCIQQNIDLKTRHTQRVCEAIRDIGATLNLSQEDLCTAEVTGWLHDIGRFEQYTRYGTFMDHRSEDHAALGVRVIRESRILKRMDVFDAKLILKVVGAHNRAGLPAEKDARTLLFLRLLRDADKVDIWHVVTSYYRDSGKKRNHALELDLPDLPRISDPVYDGLMKGRLVNMVDLKTVNDFKLLQMGWVYDVNFLRTFQIVRERGYLEAIRDALSVGSERAAHVYRRARSYVERRCQESRVSGVSIRI
ncbi:MAG: HD domain-containing protein [Deltaproteobacteria bacterium]|nr:HD domain-containing protein [Deltaproteobacteria bacterium]